MSTHNQYFDQKYEKYQFFLSENFQFLEMKFSVYLNRRVFVMKSSTLLLTSFRKYFFCMALYLEVNLQTNS